jgi:hypothetical protein
MLHIVLFFDEHMHRVNYFLLRPFYIAVLEKFSSDEKKIECVIVLIYLKQNYHRRKKHHTIFLYLIKGKLFVSRL